MGLDTERFLLCDHKGGLHLLTLKHADGKTISALELRQVGVTTCGSAITYLDSGVCFVGSAMANSQLIQLHAEPVDPQQPTNHVQVRLAPLAMRGVAVRACHRCCVGVTCACFVPACMHACKAKCVS